MSSSAAAINQQISNSEREVRCDLAAAFRLGAHFEWTEIMWNHITARVPDEPDHFLINPLGLRWDEITASTLLKIDIEGNVVAGDGVVPRAGFVIHSAVHDARPDVHACMHIHSNDGLLFPPSKTVYSQFAWRLCSSMMPWAITASRALV